MKKTTEKKNSQSYEKQKTTAVRQGTSAQVILNLRESVGEFKSKESFSAFLADYKAVRSK